MKYKRKQQEITCDYCNKRFLKDKSEVTRNSKLNRKNYCSISCSKKIKENLEHLKKVRTQDVSHLDPSNRKDEYSIFRPHLRRAKIRKQFCDLSLEDMKEVYDLQKGKCIYSKVDLQPVNYKKENNFINTMSLDRIDSTKGYTKDNIQFISISMNHLKNKLSHEKMLELIEVIKSS